MVGSCHFRGDVRFRDDGHRIIDLDSRHRARAVLCRLGGSTDSHPAEKEGTGATSASGSAPDGVSENNRGKPKAAPWVIVADGIHYGGGMERANAALAKYLIEIGVPVHLVSYRIEPSIAAHPIIT